MRSYPWRLFFLLLAGAVVSVLAVLPYLEGMLGPPLAAHPLPLPLPVVVLIQATFNFSIAIGLGILAARAVGLGAPIFEGWLYGESTMQRKPIVLTSVVTGLVLGAVLLAILATPAGAGLGTLLAVPETALPLWKRLLACAYGALGEEVLMRLFLLSVLLWVLTKLFHRPPRNPLLFWVVNAVVALAFGAGHLPFVAAMHPLTPSLVLAVVGLNALGALGFGFLYWQRGLEAAMLAHFSADIILHVVR